jgi:maltooligosyltrehalose trehalohydrolase
VAVEFVSVGGATEASFPLEPEPDGYFAGVVAAAHAGQRYKLKLDQGSYPDPASRFQPEGPHGPSEIVDPAFAWTDGAWRGRPPRELVGYELHLGTFTTEGTWRAAMTQLPELVRLGITLIEVMPIADFPGRFGWGYDGVDLFAPTRLYGTPADARAFVNRAHELGLMVILDVVYNHFGPAGNYLREFSPDYFSKKYANEWGDPINFDGDNSRPVREFFITNARYWIEEFHFDGLRLDATQQIFDASPTHILADVGAAAHAAGGGRQIWVVAEDETQRAQLARATERGGYGLDAIWNDDFHHTAHVAATGHAEAYYTGYRGLAQEFVAAAKHGFLYQGTWYVWQQNRRGAPAFDLAPRQFVHFLQNHDQVANSLRGLRLPQLTSPAKSRALTALLLLSPQIPLLFQGEEFGSSAPFVYFADHEGELRRQIKEGRRKFLNQFPSAASEAEDMFLDPGAPETFQRCKLDLSERERHAGTYQLHEDLLRLRRDDPVIAAPARFDGAVLTAHAFVLRFFSEKFDADRILVVNLGTDLAFTPAPEPLLAPIAGHGWRILWSSEAPLYGGGGTAPLETKANWMIPGEAAVLLEPDENREPVRPKLSQKD